MVKGANAIFDPVGGNVFDRSRKCISFDGRILVIGFRGEVPTIPTNHVLIKKLLHCRGPLGSYEPSYPRKSFTDMKN